MDERPTSNASSTIGPASAYTLYIDIDRKRCLTCWISSVTCEKLKKALAEVTKESVLELSFERSSKRSETFEPQVEMWSLKLASVSPTSESPPSSTAWPPKAGLASPKRGAAA